MEVREGPHPGRLDGVFGFRLVGSLVVETVTPVSPVEAASRRFNQSPSPEPLGWFVHRRRECPHSGGEVLKGTVSLHPWPLEGRSCGPGPVLSLRGTLPREGCSRWLELQEGVGSRVGWREVVCHLLSRTRERKTTMETPLKAKGGRRGHWGCGRSERAGKD